MEGLLALLACAPLPVGVPARQVMARFTGTVTSLYLPLDWPWPGKVVSCAASQRGK